MNAMEMLARCGQRQAGGQGMYATLTEAERNQVIPAAGDQIPPGHSQAYFPQSDQGLEGVIPIEDAAIVADVS